MVEERGERSSAALPILSLVQGRPASGSRCGGLHFQRWGWGNVGEPKIGSILARSANNLVCLIKLRYGSVRKISHRKSVQVKSWTALCRMMLSSLATRCLGTFRLLISGN